MSRPAAALPMLKWRLRSRVPLAMASGFALSAAFAPADVRFVAFVALVPLLVAFRGASVTEGLAVGAAFGLAFFGVLIVWLSLVGWTAWAGLVALCLAFTAVFGALAAPLSRGGPVARIAGLPLLFTAIEIARAHVPLGGFAFGTLGSSQHGGLPLLPLARAAGEYSITFALMAINALLAEAVVSRRIFARVAYVALGAGIAVAPVRLPLGAPQAGSTIDVAIVQGSVPRTYFAGLRHGRVGPEDTIIIDNHLRLTQTLAPDPPDLIVWPENSIDRDPFSDPYARAAIGRALQQTKTPMLVGAILDGPDAGHFYNSNIMYAPDQTVAGRYDKMHLVPFGEYVPWSWARKVVSQLQEIPYNGIPGRYAHTFRYPGLPPIGAVICFESTYPDLVRRFVRNGAQIIVVSTNNATFERSALARQHLAQSQMRAVELGRPVLHAAIAGVSAVIEPDGTIVREAGLFVPAILRQSVTAATGLTPFARYGTVIELGFGGAGALAAAAALALAFAKKLPPIEDEPDQFWSEPVPVADAAVPLPRALADGAPQDAVPSSSPEPGGAPWRQGRGEA